MGCNEDPFFLSEILGQDAVCRRLADDHVGCGTTGVECVPWELDVRHSDADVSILSESAVNGSSSSILFLVNSDLDLSRRSLRLCSHMLLGECLKLM